MRRLFVALFAFAASALAQNPPANPPTTTTDPTGRSCTANSVLNYIPSGTLFSCDATKHYAQITAGSATPSGPCGGALAGTFPNCTIPLAWTLNGFTFTDGTLFTGGFTYDAVNNAFTAVSFTSAGGSTIPASSNWILNPYSAFPSDAYYLVIVLPGSGGSTLQDLTGASVILALTADPRNNTPGVMYAGTPGNVGYGICDSPHCASPSQTIFPATPVSAYYAGAVETSNPVSVSTFGNFRVLGNLENAQQQLLKHNVAAGSGSPVILGLGDSVMEQNTVTNAQLYMSLVKSRTASRFANGGDGMTTWKSSPGNFVSAGTWAAVSGWGITDGTQHNPVRSNGASGTITVTCATCDTIQVHYLTGTDTSAGWTGTVDGGAPATYGNTTSGSLIWAAAAVPMGSTGAHTLVITAPSSGNAYIFSAYAYVAGTGMLLSNMGISGTWISEYSAPSAAATNQHLGWIKNMSPAPTLIIIALMENSVEFGATGLDPTLWPPYLGYALSWLQTNVPTASIVILDPFVFQLVSTEGAGDQSVLIPWYAGSRSTAVQYNTGYLNMGDRWGNEPVAEAAGMVGVDHRHPTVAGQFDYSEMLLGYLFRNSWGNGAPASTALDFPSITDGTCASPLTITLTGAKPGNRLSNGLPVLAAGLFPIIFVSAADTVSVSLCNLSGAPVNPGAQTYTVGFGQ